MMKFKCTNNIGMEHRLILGNIYEGKYDYEQKDEFQKPMILVNEDEQGLPTLYNNYRFEIVLEAC